MRVVKATRFGGPEVLETDAAPDPIVGPRDAVIDVSVAPILFLETQIRRGRGTDWFPAKPPYIPGGGVTVRGIDQVQFAPADARRLVEQALSEAAEGRIHPVIGQTFPLERAADAHAAIEARGVIGKTPLTTR